MNTEKNNLGHAMLDLETLGDESKSVIVSIGAVEFDIATGKTGRMFYRRVDIDSCLQAGLKVSGSTIRFWMGQSDIAREEIRKGGENLSIVLHHFRLWMQELGFENIQLWSRGQRFDIGLLEDAYKAHFSDVPWNFRGERDVRTLEGLRPEIYKAAVRTNNAHLPLDDCMFQIGYCSQIWQNINGIAQKQAA